MILDLRVQYPVYTDLISAVKLLISIMMVILYWQDHTDRKMFLNCGIWESTKSLEILDGMDLKLLKFLVKIWKKKNKKNREMKKTKTHQRKRQKALIENLQLHSCTQHNSIINKTQSWLLVLEQTNSEYLIIKQAMSFALLANYQKPFFAYLKQIHPLILHLEVQIQRLG